MRQFKDGSQIADDAGAKASFDATPNVATGAIDFDGIHELGAHEILASKSSFDKASADNFRGRGSRSKGPLDVWKTEHGQHLLVDGYHRLADGISCEQTRYPVRIVGEGASDIHAVPDKRDRFDASWEIPDYDEKHKQQQGFAAGGKPNIGQTSAISTPEFKDWFGDWESAKKADDLLNLDPVKIQGDEISNLVEPLDMKALRKTAKKWAKENLVGKYDNDDTTTSMTVSKKSIDDAIAHGSGPEKIQAIAAMPGLIKQAKRIYSGPSLHGKPLTSHIFASPLEISGKQFMASVVAHEDANGQVFYDHELMGMKNLDQFLSQCRAASQSEVGRPATGRGMVISMVQDWFRVNRDSASKVIDKDGSPQRVFHGSNATSEIGSLELAKAGLETDAGQLGKGLYFPTDPNVTNPKNQSVPVFLNLRNPLELSLPDFKTDKHLTLTRISDQPLEVIAF